MILFRASSVGKLMAYPEKDKLPQGAITELDTMISQRILNWSDSLDTLMIEKGKRCENDSIELYNDVHDTFYVKSVDRVTVGNLTGECDINTGECIIDIKTAYSKKTFPLMLKMSSLYEWQLRSYMYLYDVNEAELAYCLVNTPDDLIKYNDQQEWHIVDDVPLKNRVKTLKISRDTEKENQLLSRLELCEKYIKDSLELLA